MHKLRRVVLVKKESGEMEEAHFKRKERPPSASPKPPLPGEEKLIISLFARASIQKISANVDLQSTGKVELVLPNLSLALGLPKETPSQSSVRLRKYSMPENAGNVFSGTQVIAPTSRKMSDDPNLPEDRGVLRESNPLHKMNKKKHNYWAEARLGGLFVHCRERLSGSLIVEALTFSAKQKASSQEEIWEVHLAPRSGDRALERLLVHQEIQHQRDLAIECELAYDASKIVSIHLQGVSVKIRSKLGVLSAEVSLRDLEVLLASKTVQAVFSIGQKLKESVEESLRYAQQNVHESQSLRSLLKANSMANMSEIEEEERVKRELQEEKKTRKFSPSMFGGEIRLNVVDEKGIKLFLFPYEIHNPNGVLLELSKFEVHYLQEYRVQEGSKSTFESEYDLRNYSRLFPFSLDTLPPGSCLSDRLSVTVGLSACKIERNGAQISKEDIIRIPTSTHLSLDTLFDVHSRLISYSLVSDFEQSIFLTTNLSLYAYLKEMIDIVLNEAKKSSFSKSESKKGDKLSAKIILSQPNKDQTSPEKETLPVEEEIWRKGINYKKLAFLFDPKVNILGNTTPPVLGWVYHQLGVKRIDIELPIFLYTKMSKNFEHSLLVVKAILSKVSKIKQSK